MLVADFVGEPVSDAEIDDATLATRAAEGDVAAFEMLLRRYQDRVFGMSLRMLADRAEAEDVAQEVFVTAWRRLGELADPGAVRTWLFRIAHRQCLGVIRKRRDRRTEPTDTLPDSTGTAVGTAGVDGSIDPQRATEAGAGVRALYRALRQLPPPQRAVWLLAEVDGLSYAEIAQVVGATEQAVRGRLSRARARLAEVMRAWR
ncbi:RNA polymerase sigma-70 factor, ECF subfamily [Goodfellowiella coeruleoviolacea]|uniref:RNA polymerase sigma factor n=1 Tax=Goodfellowiella coeruleoviolacea TaxID=334858 RepID=A0AAE3KF48_9PSEU|nr:RNA polymerase sigma-70 factor, ECF subfamily [Goodfellowiella coeruleoviolacea]